MMLLFTLLAFSFFQEVPLNTRVIKETKRIELEEFPEAFNPSILPFKEGYLCSFRYTPDPLIQPHISYIGIVLLDSEFHPTSPPKILNTRFVNNHISSQSEDARLFSYRGRIFLLFNDNPAIENPSYSDPRDIYIAELTPDLELSIPLKLFYNRNKHQLWQKNWIPFEWKKNLFLAYSISPHEILQPNFFDGECFCSHLTESPQYWAQGVLRGGTPALFVDGEYLSFFHSSLTIPSEKSYDLSAWFYFIGAYTFSPDPPFKITKMTLIPLSHPDFYDLDFYSKKVIFPGGFIDAGELIYLAYGRNDCEMWIATLDKKALKEALYPLK